MAAGLEKASLQQIAGDPKMLALALAQGKAAFGDNCTPCHGAGGQGQKGYPNLTADAGCGAERWSRSRPPSRTASRADDDPDTHASAMPAFGKDGILKPEQIRQVANYVRTLDGLEPEQGVDVAAGKKVFADNCVACHGEDGKGNLDMGSANLTTKVWLYGNDIKDLVYTITNARNCDDAGVGQAARSRRRSSRSPSTSTAWAADSRGRRNRIVSVGVEEVYDDGPLYAKWPRKSTRKESGGLTGD